MSAEEYLPQQMNLETLREAAETCHGCELYQRATQTVFGAGLRQASLMLVGEVPGDQEDRLGQPFVGPAGRLLEEMLEEVGIAREATYVTNAVKHFSFEEKGRRRLHKKPTWSQIQACKPWLMAEIAVVQPRLVVCLGATAAQSLLGREVRVTRQRGMILPWDIAEIMMTYHPSAVLRAPQEQDRGRMRRELISDLRVAVEQLGTE